MGKIGRLKRMTAYILAAAIVFGMNTAVFGECDILTEEPREDVSMTGTIEEQTDDELKEALKKDGWEATGTVSYNNHILTIVDNNGAGDGAREYVNLTGEIDSEDITVSYYKGGGSTVPVTLDNISFSSPLNLEIVIGKELKVTLLKSDAYGYNYLVGVNNPQDVESWAKESIKDLPQPYLNVDVDLSESENKIICTYFVDRDVCEESNLCYGEVHENIMGYDVCYPTYIPYYGGKSWVEETRFITGIPIRFWVDTDYYGGSFGVLPAKFKYIKGTNTARIKVVDVGNGAFVLGKKEQRRLIKAINNKKITMNVYPRNISKIGEVGYVGENMGEYEFDPKDEGQPTLSGKKGKYKFKGEIEENCKFSLKEGKHDGLGGTVKIEKAEDGGLIVSCNAFRGKIPKGFWVDKSK